MQLRIDVRRAQPRRRGVVSAILASLAVAFVVLAVLAPDAPHGFDRSISESAHDLTAGSSFIEFVCDALAWAFQTPVVLSVFALLTAGALWERRWRIAIWLGLSALIATFGNNGVVKNIFDRPRPAWSPELTEATGHAFPSGHATAAAALTVALGLLTLSTTHRGVRRWVALGILTTLAFAVAASRVLLGVHYPTDVLAGLASGAFSTYGLWVLIPGDRRHLPQPLRVLTGSGARHAGVILNPIKVGDVETFKDRVRAEATAAGWGEPLWFETTVEDPGRGQTHAALAAGVDMLVAAGGDGTVREVCEEAARTGVPVAIIPHGTGNLLARNLGIPLNSRAALEVAFDGQDRSVDLATFSTDSGVDSAFLVMAGVGFDAMIMGGVDDGLKEKVGWAAYVVSGVKALRFPRMLVTITVDDAEPVTMKAKTVVIGNVGFLQGGLPLMPDAKIDDGLLDVIVLAPRRLLGWLAIVARVLTRSKNPPANRIARFTGRQIVVESDLPMPMQLDGDPVGDGTRLVAEANPGVLLVRVPAV